MPRVLITGMSGAGKSTLLDGLARRGHRVVDTDYDGWVLTDGRWDAARMADLLGRESQIVLAGTVENQADFYDRFDHVVLLSAPLDVLIARVSSRITNPYGRNLAEQDEIARYVRSVEPLLRRSATHELDGRAARSDLVSAVEELLRLPLRSDSAPEKVIPCRVWIADLAESPVRRPDHVDLLDQAERGRLGKLRRPQDRARFVIGAALLRLVVAAELNAAPKDVVIDRSCDRCGQPHGKPRIPGTDLHVSVSHSGDLAAVALTQAGPVGIDVEAKISRDVEGLAKTVLSPEEVLGSPDDFYVYWCRKEAVVKATGAGLRIPLVDVVVSDARAEARLLRYPGTSIDCAINDLEVQPGYAGAIAVLAPGALRVDRQDVGDVAGF